MKAFFCIVTLMFTSVVIADDVVTPAQQWNWDGDGITNKYVAKKGKKEPLFEKQKVINKNEARLAKERTRQMVQKTPEKRLPFYYPPIPFDYNMVPFCCNPIPVYQYAIPYNRYPIINPDGSFQSIRYFDINPVAGQLYQVSGAAIKAYGLRSAYARNQLERDLDNDLVNRRMARQSLLRGHPVAPYESYVGNSNPTPEQLRLFNLMRGK